ncbi:PAS-domain containing protein [Simplicispira lacusdiani]|uniref:PAS-domain containing protein n=1 Tax=Simplicispira lacusdiani TaxID=2213010 RepID=UPI0018E4FD8D|nr:PAS-domain containing protein [Simplicispira lacusdiani]
MDPRKNFLGTLAPPDELKLFRDMLEHLPVGIALFDADLRVTAINHLLLRLLDFPPELFAPRLPTLEDLLYFNACRGEYGPGDPRELTRQRMDLARKREAHRFVRQRPGGAMIEVIGAPLPGGGFASIYTDITEREHNATAMHDQALYLTNVLAHLPQGISVFDEQLRLKCWNDKLLEVLDLPPEGVYPDVPFEDLIRYPAQRGEFGPGDPEAYVAQRREWALRFEPHRLERHRPNGRTHLVEGRPMQADGRTVGFITSYTDITENKAREATLAEKNELLQTLADNLPCGVSIFDKDLHLVLMNDEAIRLLGFTRELVDQRPHFSALARFNAERGEYGTVDVERFVAELTAKAQHPTQHHLERVRPNGTVIDIMGAPLPHGGFVSIYSDVTEQRQAAQAIERLAHHDTLTGLANRYTLEARLDQLVADARRHGRRLAVLFLDMDNFKGINDSLGHAMGDDFLRETARRLRDAVRANDIVARLGGDEFVVVLTEVDNPQHAINVASKLLEQLARPVVLAGHELRASTSIGICFYPEDGQDRGSLMQSADIAMYQAKGMGKGVYRCFDADMMALAARRAALERALKQAVAQQAFDVHYQPLLDCRGGQVRGLEALIRWRDPEGRWIPPLDFIPLAEELGLINQMGEWVLRTACAALAQWRQQGLELTVSVNLSAVQLRNPQLPEQIADALRTHGLPASALTLEVTESVAMQDPLASVRRLEQIRALGVRLAMDDFGTGYSSLAYLQRLPLDYLKLDRTFVQNLESSPGDAAICTATIGLAHHLGLAVVAEGVETEGQHAFLDSLGCDMCQGYLFSRPLPQEDATAWLHAAAQR